MRWSVVLAATAAIGLGAASEDTHGIDAGKAEVLNAEGATAESKLGAPKQPPARLERSASIKGQIANPTKAKSEPRTIKERLWRWTFRLGRDPVAVLTLLLFVIGGIQLEISRRTARRQLRAYVSNSPRAVFFLEAGKRPQIRSDVRNHGQTPAFDVGHMFEIAVLDAASAENPVLPEPTRKIDNSTTLFPGDMWTWFNAANSITQDEIEAMRREEARLYVWGITTYSDAFGKKHRTRFCAYVSGAQFVEQMEQKPQGGNFTWTFGPNHGQAT